ncbi:winged helix-turn-helix transcriptional regulator [Sinorhizobium americanum]|uniref:winged helix-turn-helix transcriptional regulator n=1 Tax=Sinorhizobium americanum TaxID=194963 RepID=UPI001F446643|nr:helix-turn-helix domain-containing protein [Sinorhizobium americanum]
MSPALLIKRLRDLEAAGIVRRVASRTEPGILEYRLTPAGWELKPVIEAIGIWGQRWFEANVSLQHLDPSLLMWDIHRNIDPATLPPRRCVIQFLYPELPAARRRWWLLIEPGADVDLCSVDPGLDIRHHRPAHHDCDLDGSDDCQSGDGRWKAGWAMRSQCRQCR